jgi:hypothetical protein
MENLEDTQKINYKREIGFFGAVKDLAIIGMIGFSLVGLCKYGCEAKKFKGEVIYQGKSRIDGQEESEYIFNYKKGEKIFSVKLKGIERKLAIGKEYKLEYEKEYFTEPRFISIE